MAIVSFDIHSWLNQSYDAGSTLFSPFFLCPKKKLIGDEILLVRDVDCGGGGGGGGGDFLGRCVSVCVCVSAANRVPISTVKRPYLAGRSGPGLRLSVRRFAVIFIEPAHTHTNTHTHTCT